MKRLICLFLCICIWCQMPIAQVYAEEVSRQKITVDTGNGNVKEYTASVEGNEIYLSAQDIAEIGGYVCDIGEQIGFAKRLGSSFYQFDVDFDGRIHNRGRNYQIEVIQRNGQYYLPLEKILYLMHTAWCVEGAVLYVNTLPYSLPDFFTDFQNNLFESQTTDADLLMNGESNLMRSIRSSLANMIRNFDTRYYIPYWGVNEKINEEYENILIKLTEAEEQYVGEIPEAMVEEELQGTMLSELSEEYDYLKFMTQVPEKIDYMNAGIDKVLEKYGSSNGIAKKISANVNLVDFFGKDKLETISKRMKNIGNGLSLLSAINSIAEVSEKADQMNDMFLKEMEILRDFDADRYDGASVSHIKAAAANVINTKKATVEAVKEKTLEEVMNFLGEKAAGLTVAGKAVAAIQTSDILLSKISKNYTSSMEAATISYMLGQSVNLEFIALQELTRFLQDMNDLDYQYNMESAEKIRNAAFLYLNLNLRNKCYIYYLNLISNNQNNWEISDQARNLKKEIAGIQAMQAALIATEGSDRQIILDDYDKMYNDEEGMTREKIAVEILHDDKEEKKETFVKNNRPNNSHLKITEDTAIKLARQKMGDDFGYVFSEKIAYNGTNYYMILVTGKVDGSEDAPVTTITKIFVSEDGTQVREGAEYYSNGVISKIEFFD